MHYCSSCGNKVSDQDRFCSNCGGMLQTPETEAEIGDVQPQQSSPKVKRKPPRKKTQPPPQPSARPTAEVPHNANKPAHAGSVTAVRQGGKGGLSFFGVLIAIGWLFYSSGLLGVVAGAYYFNLDQAIAQADWISFALMIGLPLGISAFRPILDIIITPLYFVKVLIPGRILVGMGLLAPFAVSWLLYTVWGFRNYQFLHYSLVFGTLITYAILRTPQRYSS